MLTAMITPMTGDGAVDYDGAARLAEHLVTAMRNDGLVISGTTGESPTTTDAEKEQLLRAVIEAVGDRATVIAGVGTNDTAHSCELARQAEQAGAAALLVVTPYYNKPPQSGLRRALHHGRRRDRAAGDALRHPGPHRPCRSTPRRWSGWPSTPRIVAVKDAKDDLGAGSLVHGPAPTWSSTAATTCSTCRGCRVGAAGLRQRASGTWSATGCTR